MTTTDAPQTNGIVSPSYKTLSHLKSYPLIADGISAFESNPYGKRTLSVSHTAYIRFIAPLSSYLSVAAPYFAKADDLADGGLAKVEIRFPIVKEPVDTIKTRMSNTIGYPRKVFGEIIGRGSDLAKKEKDHVFKVYDDAYAKLGQEKGCIPVARAGVQTGLVVSSELVGAIASYLSAKKAQTQEKATGTTK